MLVTNCNRYHSLKPSFYEEFILNPRLMNEVKLRKYKYRIIEKKFLAKANLVLQRSCPIFLKNIGTLIKYQIKKCNE